MLIPQTFTLSFWFLVFFVVGGGGCLVDCVFVVVVVSFNILAAR